MDLCISITASYYFYYWYVYFDWYWFTLFVYAFVLALVTLAMDVLCDLAVLSNYWKNLCLTIVEAVVMRFHLLRLEYTSAWLGGVSMFLLGLHYEHILLSPVLFLVVSILF